MIRPPHDQSLIRLFLIIACLTSSSAFSMYGRGVHADQHELLDRRDAVDRYIRSPGDSYHHAGKLKLTQTIPRQPIFVSDAARVNYRGTAELPILDQVQHELHYIVGATDAAMNAAVVRDIEKPAPLNILLLALEIVFLKPEKDKSVSLQRETFPVLYDRSRRELTLAISEHAGSTEYCFFLSYNNKSKRAKNTHGYVVELSVDTPFSVPFRDRTIDAYFHPSIIAQDEKKLAQMKLHFPGIKQPFHSEANAVYWLMNTPSLVEKLFQSLPMRSEILSFGLRYLSFLDMCEGCQEFLEESQVFFRLAFLNTLNVYVTKKQLKRFREEIPFLTFAHGNRVYGGNTYESSGKHYKSKKLEEEDLPYRYATSGPEEGGFVREFMRFGGILKPRNKAINRLVEIVHEADLGKYHELGKTRKYLSEASEIDFPRQGLQDEELHVLTSKAERADPLKITHFDISSNQLGWNDPEFGDDPIPLTDGRMLASTIRFIGICVNLESLFLGGSVLGRVVPKLMLALPHLVKLRVLYLNDLGLSVIPSNEMASLLSALPPLRYIEVLNVSNNNLLYEGVDVLSSLVKQYSTLKELYIRRINPLPVWDGETHPSDVHYVDDRIDGYIDDATAFLSLAEVIRDAPHLAFVDIKDNCSDPNKTYIRSKFLEIIGRDVSHHALPTTSAKPNNP